MEKNVFAASNDIRNLVNRWPIEDRPKDDSSYFGYDPENEIILPIETDSRDLVPNDIGPGYLFRVDFDQTGETFEIVLVAN